MSENKKYYYMKLKENFFTSERMVVLEMMPDGILYSNLLLKMYLMSLKHNGILLLHENLPHTPQTILKGPSVRYSLFLSIADTLLFPSAFTGQTL